MSRLDDIEARLAAATQGERELVQTKRLFGDGTPEYQVKLPGHGKVILGILMQQGDAYVFAHAPADLAALLAVARAARKCREIEQRFHTMSDEEWASLFAADMDEHWKQETDAQEALFAALDALEAQP